MMDADMLEADGGFVMVETVIGPDGTKTERTTKNLRKNGQTQVFTQEVVTTTTMQEITP
jgi:hypothetical protein